MTKGTKNIVSNVFQHQKYKFAHNMHTNKECIYETTEVFSIIEN